MISSTLKIVFGCILFASLIARIEASDSAAVTLTELTHNSAVVVVTAEDNSGDPITDFTLAAGGTITPAVTPDQNPSAGTAGNFHSLTFSSLTPATMYSVGIGATAKTDASTTSIAAADTLEIKFCTNAEPILGLAVDDAGTDTSKIKVTWTAPTTAVAFEAYIGDTKIDDIAINDPTEFVYTASDAAGTPLDSSADYTCKIKTQSVTCEGQTIQAEASVSCKAMVSSGGTDDDDGDAKCDSVTERMATWMIVLNASFFYALKTMLNN